MILCSEFEIGTHIPNKCVPSEDTTVKNPVLVQYQQQQINCNKNNSLANIQNLTANETSGENEIEIQTAHTQHIRSIPNNIRID